MTYEEAIAYLYGLRMFGTKFGLENTRKLAELAGNPQEKLRFIHVAGTNGKGSTCAMLESIYRQAGKKTGLYTSPHLVYFGERIQVNRAPISKGDVVRHLAQLQPLLASFSPDSHPTFFEVVTVMALMHFAAEKCDLVIWETGLGGRLDATNIVTPMASVITTIQHDHEKWLGVSLAEIAREKAGIIKEAIPVITTVPDSEALGVIKATAMEKNAPFTRVPAPTEEVRVSLIGEHQQHNAALAIAVVEELNDTFRVPNWCIAAGLEKVNWPGRFQILNRPAARKIVLDGAHNPAGAFMLAKTFRQWFAREEATLIMGFLTDKNYKAMCEILAPLAKRIMLAPVQTERTASPELLWQLCRDANPSATIICCASLEAALNKAALDSLVLVTGSLYLIGEALELMKLQPVEKSERKLNEWSAKPAQEKAPANENESR
jgi:dihydrofolate synthase/folylpolyglutamate synthase